MSAEKYGSEVPSSLTLEPNPFEQSFVANKSSAGGEAGGGGFRGPGGPGGPGAHVKGQTLPGVQGLTSPAPLIGGPTPGGMQWPGAAGMRHAGAVGGGHLSPAILQGPNGEPILYNAAVPSPGGGMLNMPLESPGPSPHHMLRGPGQQMLPGMPPAQVHGGYGPGQHSSQYHIAGQGHQAHQQAHQQQGHQHGRQEGHSHSHSQGHVQGHPSGHQASVQGHQGLQGHQGHVAGRLHNQGQHGENSAVNSLYLLSQTPGRGGPNGRASPPGQLLHGATPPGVSPTEARSKPRSKRGSRDKTGPLAVPGVDDAAASGVGAVAASGRIGKARKKSGGTAPGEQAADAALAASGTAGSAGAGAGNLSGAEDAGDGTGDAEEEKRKQFLERNRVAAIKCRQRKKQWVDGLKGKLDFYMASNDELGATIASMQNQLDQLKLFITTNMNSRLLPPPIQAIIEQPGPSVRAQVPMGLEGAPIPVQK